MRIIVNGQQPFGAAVLRALLDRGEEVVAVYCAPDREGRGPDPLKEAALAANIPVRQPASFKDEETAADVAGWRPDLMVMAFVTILVPESVLDIPTHGAIQYHPSLLPAHRGPSAINWAIIEGERTTGLTIFWPDEGLDTGPILLTKEVPIDEDDTVGSLYFDKLFPLGVAALVESVDLVREGVAPRVVQDEAKATYEGWCRRPDVELDWGASTRRVRDLIRGSNPRPGAWTTLGDREVTILTARATEPGPAGGEPGEVLAVGPDGVVVATADGALAVTEGRLGHGERLGAADLADQAGLTVGTRLGAA
jgi:methionyl-tRNA formyltransferase